MSSAAAADLDRRVLVLAATRRDADLTRALLAPLGILTEVCATLPLLVQHIEAGAAAVIVTEEQVTRDGLGILARAVARQPAWSDLPVLVLARPGAASAEIGDALRTLGNVTILERPLRVATLMSAVRTAVRARERQYQTRGYLADRARVEDALRIADRRKDEFLATLGHELRNPLAPMLASLHLLNLAPTGDDRTRRAVEIMERQVRHLMRLVDDLLEVSRITRGLIDVRKEPLDLGGVIRTAVETSRPLIDAARQQLDVRLPARPLPIAGDAVRLTQVFANLLNNASKYTDAGGAIRLDVCSDGDWIEVAVRDNGIGIPAARLGTVFDMFTQVDRSHRRAQGGLGIGLTIVQSLVTMHGGEVEARSDGPGRGSEFVVRLPLLREPALPTEASRVPLPFPPRRVLIVDDNQDAAETLGALLTALGATVLVTSSGPDALERIAAFAPEAILLDIGMPGMDGYEVARHIRATPGFAQVLIVALTGWGQDEDYERSREAGIDHHLVKPPDLDRLRAILVGELAADPRVALQRAAAAVPDVRPPGA